MTKNLVKTVRLVGFSDNFPDVAESARAVLFGAMIKRAAPVMKEYHSDLYHDANWLRENLNGPMTFDWLVRYSGTNLQEGARISVKIGAGEGATFYRVRVFHEKGVWFAEFTNVPLDQVPHLQDL